MTDMPTITAFSTMYSAKLLTTIKGTARNKDRARVWLEMGQDKLAPYGFSRGARINITIGQNAILVETVKDGARKVAGREKSGRTICILDICFDSAKRAQMFQGAERLQVWIQPGKLLICAPNIPAII